VNNEVVVVVVVVCTRVITLVGVPDSRSVCGEFPYDLILFKSQLISEANSTIFT
jgi:hypothetical protein